MAKKRYENLGFSVHEEVLYRNFFVTQCKQHFQVLFKSFSGLSTLHLPDFFVGQSLCIAMVHKPNESVTALSLNEKKVSVSHLVSLPLNKPADAELLVVRRESQEKYVSLKYLE
uniref:Uncharacterized protein n=1 Tax=Cryptomonas curvata TaxID=233186 RepID=A0A7S0N2D8_9CRYP|mmetsp:Transcript_58497/g.122219  ORF Transcript_58497/g.122219 Transcript_58497/m.122219 type:complete len:114 (+) Transcript_58497:203-544(+)